MNELELPDPEIDVYERGDFADPAAVCWMLGSHVRFVGDLTDEKQPEPNHSKLFCGLWWTLFKDRSYCTIHCPW